jgi:hypothetical protein
VRRANNNERNEIMQTVAYTGRFYTTPDLVRSLAADIEEGNLLATNFSLVADFDSINFSLHPQTAAREPVLARWDIKSMLQFLSKEEIILIEDC